MTAQQLVQQNTFTDAYQRYEKDLKWHAFFKVRDKALSQDLVQSTFMKAWNYMLKGGEIYMMKAFLYRILNHLIIDEYRKHKTESLDNLLEQRELEELGTDDHEKVSEAFEAQSAPSLISKLPEKFQEIMHLRYIKDLSINEISALTGQSKNSVAVQAYRGRQKLRMLYNQRQAFFLP